MPANKSRTLTAAALILAALSQSALAAGAPATPGSDRMFNPQPEPPADVSQFQQQGLNFSNLSVHSFNPQPEPPPAGAIGGLKGLKR